MNDITPDFNVRSKDLRILELLMKKPHTITEISKSLKMDYKNTHRYCMKLYSLKQVHLDPTPDKSKRGSPVMVSLAINHGGDDINYTILKTIAEQGGRISHKDYYALFKKNKSFLQENGVDGKYTNLLYLELFSGYIRKEMVLTKEGKKFLKEYGEKYNRKQKLKNIIKRKIYK